MPIVANVRPRSRRGTADRKVRPQWADRATNRASRPKRSPALYGSFPGYPEPGISLPRGRFGPGIRRGHRSPPAKAGRGHVDLQYKTTSPGRPWDGCLRSAGNARDCRSHSRLPARTPASCRSRDLHGCRRASRYRHLGFRHAPDARAGGSSCFRRLAAPARSGAGVIIIMYENAHRPLLSQRLPLNLAVGVNVAVLDLDRFAGQTDNPLDREPLTVVGAIKGDDFPTGWPSQLKRGAVDRTRSPASTRAVGGRANLARQFGQTASGTSPLSCGIAGKREPALRACQVDMAAQQGRCHRPTLHYAENGEALDKPRVKHDQSREKQDRALHERRKRR